MVLFAKEIPESADLNDDGQTLEGKKEQTVVFRDKKCTVEKVQITGMKKTKADFVVDDLRRVTKADSFITAYHRSMDCRARLLQKGIFDRVEVIMDTTSHYEGKKAPDGIQILFRVKEKRRLTGEAKTEISTNDQPCWVLRLMSPNVFGRGEMLTASFSRKLGADSKDNAGFYFPNDFSLSAVKPFNNGSLFRLTVLSDLQECPWNSTALTTRGAEAEYQFPLFSNVHTVAWHAHWRELGSSNRMTAFPVREEFGHSLKSSLLHSVTMDRTDDKILPSRGYSIKMTEEFAGIGTGDKFIRENMEFQFHRSLFGLLTMSAGFRGGFIAPLDNQNTKIVDRFFIGGPLTLRGFEMNCAGPQVDGDFTGGNCYWLAGVHAYLPLPFHWKNFGKGSWLDGFRLHGFVNAGNVLTFSNARLVREQLSTIADNVRVSCGLGLVYSFMKAARLELNFCVPKKVGAGDKVSDGLQFGIGISSL